MRDLFPEDEVVTVSRAGGTRAGCSVQELLLQPVAELQATPWCLAAGC